MARGSYSTNADYAQLFGELVIENEPLSWIAGLGELSPEHKAPPGSTLKPEYLFTAELRQQFILARVGGRFQLSVDPVFNVRMRRDLPSLPVKTPSYHIGAWGAFSLFQDTATSVVMAHYVGGATGQKRVETVRFAYVQAGFFHYSNGQDRPPLLGQATNELGGNFSVNSLHFAGVMGKRDDDGFRSGTLGLVLGPRAWGADEALPGRYNLVRGSLKLTKQWFRGYRYVDSVLTGKTMSAAQQRDYVEKAQRSKQRWQADLTASYGLSSLALLEESRRGLGKRLNAELMVTYTPVWLLQAGFFATLGYYGEDPYNIMYLHQYPFVRAGVAVGPLHTFWKTNN